MKQLNRRQLLNVTSKIAAAAPLAVFSQQIIAADAKKPEAKKPDAKKPEAKKPDAKKPEAKKPEAQLTLVDIQKSSVAKALNYTHEAASAGKARLDRTAPLPGKEQFCHNCMLYTEQGKIANKAVGKCSMIPDGMVASDGWCTSWIKKPS